MNLTIKDVLQSFQDQSVVLVAGSGGLENTVTSVNIMDAPDIWNWVKPGDLILTTAYAIKDDPCLQEQLIRELAKSGSAGLGIKTKRFLPEIPAVMRQVADELGFPLLELPLNLSLAEIMNPVISSIAARQSYLLQRSSDIHKALTNEAINGGGLEPIIRCLGRLTQCPVGCYDTKGAPLSNWLPTAIPGVKPAALSQIGQILSSKVTGYEDLQQDLSTQKLPHTNQLPLGEQVFHITSFAIMSSNEFFGHISVIQPTDAFLDLNCIALEHACTVAALDFLKQKAVAQSRRLRSRDTLEHILFGDLANPVTLEIISASKLAQARHFQCIIVTVDQTPDEMNMPIVLNRLYKVAQQIITAQYPLSLISEHTGQLIALLAANSALHPEELHAKLYKACQALHKHITVSIGIGSVVPSMELVRNSYQDAVTCLKIGRSVKGTGTLTYPYEIASYYLLERSQATEILDQACSPFILKLEAHDHSHGSDLLQTLNQYLECDKNMTDTANELYIHRNTLANRLEKIIDVTGLDFSNRELLFNIRLALRKKKTAPAAYPPQPGSS